MKAYKIVGRLWASEPSYYSWDTNKEYPWYEQVSSRIWTINAENLTSAEQWLKDTHPEFYQGSTIICMTPGVCEFILNPCP